ncbi:tRNA (adenosine(37)-N6)-threonylcarbamoyltransferase complex dimerization subunit type 1 TsaB [Holzapfeliella sp. He02]|uniref:tRNA (Adenosine(37)-N6)-threonylcarbamoyltransferase complex dimerization subunit type 1 TsaB n=1 Tax=Holzapfeliella saturejae TaxID=3082953 RepID=A0ABU8SFJ4_9LACO
MSTATSQLSVALKTHAQVIEENKTDSRNHSIHLMPTIEKLLNQEQLTLSDIDAFVVAKGPGSYTGVRIGVTAAKTMAKVLDKELYGVSTLALLARNSSDEQALIVPVIDARNHNFFAAAYTVNHQGHYEEQLKEQHIGFKDLVNELTKKAKVLGKTKLVFVGESLESQQEAFPNFFEPKEVSLEVCPDSLVHAESAIAMTDQLTPEVIDQFVPEYLRKTQAETDWAKTHGSHDGDQYVEEV